MCAHGLERKDSEELAIVDRNLREAVLHEYACHLLVQLFLLDALQQVHVSDAVQHLVAHVDEVCVEYELLCFILHSIYFTCLLVHHANNAEAHLVDGLDVAQITEQLQSPFMQQYLSQVRLVVLDELLGDA